MKITDLLNEAPPAQKKIELIYCLQSYPSPRAKDSTGAEVPYFGKISVRPKNENIQELRRIGQIPWGEEQAVWDLILDIHDGRSMLWMGHWNDGVM